MSLVVWAVSGILTTFIVLSYIELAGMFPRAGGDYAYMMAIIGPLPAFLKYVRLVYPSVAFHTAEDCFAKTMSSLGKSIIKHNVSLNLGSFFKSSISVTNRQKCHVVNNCTIPNHLKGAIWFKEHRPVREVVLQAAKENYTITSSYCHHQLHFECCITASWKRVFIYTRQVDTTCSTTMWMTHFGRI